MKSNTKQIALQRVKFLFQQAKKIYRDNPQLSNRYITNARRIAMAAKIPFPKLYRRQICKKCNTILVQGDNCRIRIKQKREPHMVITCLNCGSITRIHLKKKKEENQT